MTYLNTKRETPILKSFATITENDILKLIMDMTQKHAKTT